MTSGAEEHWQRVWRERAPDQLSWHQERADISLALITRSLTDRSAPIIDVGGGDSPLAGELIAAGFSDITVLDIAEAALVHARRRLGTAGDAITWLARDITRFEPERSYQLWHDRAVFHFLTNPAARHRYTQVAAASVEPDGWLIIATFAADGPDQCSGLPVQRHTPHSLTDALASAFTAAEFTTERHSTPNGNSQTFLYGRFQRESRS